jgi:glycosyltransferase involved in cell wall biosynthesis
MATPFSIVIICRNESKGIAHTLSGLRGLSDDIIVYDTGSTDGTQAIVRAFPVRLIEGAWQGFGPTKNTANACSKHDWILSLDADEVPDEKLRTTLLNWEPPSVDVVYACTFLNYIGDRPVRFGEWGWDRHIRLFNRTRVQWDAEPVHEQLQFPPGVAVIRLSGKIQHRTVRDWADHQTKMEQYAQLNAHKYYARGKAAPRWKLWLSPSFTWMHYYILKLGFLDGRAGWQCAWLTARYTYWKYAHLRKLYRA